MLNLMGKLSDLPGKRGELKVRLGIQDGCTVIKDLYNRVPLKVAHPLYLEPETGELFIYQMNTGGGLVQGDSCHLQIEVEAGARAFFTTQAATKIYRAPDSYAYQRNLFKLGEKAVLEYFPEPVIPFAGSKFRSETEIRLTKGATAFFSEIVTPGRVKRGEIFNYQYYHSRTKAFWDEELVLLDNWCLYPGRKELRSLGIYDDFTHQGNIFIFSEKVNQELGGQLRQMLADRPRLLIGTSLTLKNGIVVRILGYRACDLGEAISFCWDVARKALLGLPAPKIGK